MSTAPERNPSQLPFAVTDFEIAAGGRYRLKHDPGRIGVATGRSRILGGVPKLQVQFPEGSQFIPSDQLEEVAAEEDALDLMQRGRLGDQLDLRLTLAHARLTGRLADVIYSMDVTGTDFYAHQFKPVVRLLNSVARGILIADEGGLGKTIEAGLLWTELRTRYDFRKLLVLCPSVLRQKWQRELRTRFGVDAEILDAKGTLARLRRAGDGANPGFAIVASLQGLRPRRKWRERRQADGASELARFLDSQEQSDPLIDMCVIDEAHHLRNRETMTSQLGRLTRAVSDYIVLLTATPIHLRSNAPGSGESARLRSDTHQKARDRGTARPPRSPGREGPPHTGRRALLQASVSPMSAPSDRRAESVTSCRHRPSLCRRFPTIGAGSSEIEPTARTPERAALIRRPRRRFFLAGHWRRPRRKSNGPPVKGRCSSPRVQAPACIQGRQPRDRRAVFPFRKP